MKRLAIIAGSAAMVAISACAQSAQSSRPAAVPIIVVAMAEYRFDHARMADPGRTILHVVNRGTESHELTLLALPAEFDKPVEALFQDGETRSFATTALVFAKPPGGVAKLAVDLRPGRYALICFVENSAGLQHVRIGMLSELRVSAGTESPPPDRPTPGA